MSFTVVVVSRLPLGPGCVLSPLTKTFWRGLPQCNGRSFSADKCTKRTGNVGVTRVRQEKPGFFRSSYQHQHQHQSTKVLCLPFPGRALAAVVSYGAKL